DQVVPVPLEERVLADEHLNAEVAARGAGVAGLALAAELEPHPALDAGGDVHLHVGDLGVPSRATAVRAGVGHADPFAAARGAGGGDLGEPARLDDLALSAAVVAGRCHGPLAGAASPAVGAVLLPFQVDGLRGAAGRLDQFDLQLVEEVLS